MILDLLKNVTSPVVETVADVLALGNKRIKRFEMQGTDNKSPTKTITLGGPDSSSAYSVTVSIAPVAPDDKSVSADVKTLTVTNEAPHADVVLNTGSNSFIAWVSAISGTTDPLGDAVANGRVGLCTWMEC